MGTVTIVGLGPGSLGFITLETWDKLKNAQRLLLRTQKHPTVAGLIEHGITFQSYDAIYDNKGSFDEVYTSIAQAVIEYAQSGENVVYAVPGSPLVAEKTVVLLRELGKKYGIEVQVLPGMSFMEILYARLSIDPIEGVTIIDSSDINELPNDLPTSLVVTQVYNKQIASDLKIALMDLYPDEYEIVLVKNLGLPDELIKTIPLYMLDRQGDIDHLTSVYVPYRKSDGKCFELESLIDIMAKLRSPGGCIWDIEQTHESLRRNLIEEVYEVVEAIDIKNAELLCEELGDLLLQIVFHARMAEETGDFSMQDVIDGINQKLIRRHPHVFGDINVRDAGEVVLNWDKIKQQEKAGERKNVLDGIPKDLPGLMRAQKLQQKAAKVGFDWDNISFVWDKIREEVAELKIAIEQGDNIAIEDEWGDYCFSLVNLARFLHIDAEVAINKVNGKFQQRFSYIENALRRSGKKWEEVSLTDMDRLWDEAKTLK